MKRIKKSYSDPRESNDFDEKDHRLAYGWYVDIEGSGQRKRYLRLAREEKQKT